MCSIMCSINSIVMIVNVNNVIVIIDGTAIVVLLKRPKPVVSGGWLAGI